MDSDGCVCVRAGLASVVAPAVKVLDQMYAAQIVMKQYGDHYGLDWTKWDKDLLESVQRRHTALEAVRAHRCFVFLLFFVCCVLCALFHFV